jgi:hypothetical protein
MTMKKLLLVLCVACALFASLFLTTNCTERQNGEFVTDSIKYSKVEKASKVDFVADYPTKGNPALVQIVREWISEEMGGTYKGSYAAGDSLLGFYGKAAIDTLIVYSKDMEPGMNLENRMSVRKTYETDKLVTFEASSYAYFGGAHGGATLEGATFRKSDGRKFGWDIFKLESRFSKVQDIIKAGLKQYFKVNTDDELKENLLNPDQIYVLPLPQAVPYFTKEGVKFVYAQYEIACYAAGMPSFTVPYDKIKDALTVSAAALID